MTLLPAGVIEVFCRHAGLQMSLVSAARRQLISPLVHKWTCSYRRKYYYYYWTFVNGGKKTLPLGGERTRLSLGQIETSAQEVRQQTSLDGKRSEAWRSYSNRGSFKWQQRKSTSHNFRWLACSSLLDSWTLMQPFFYPIVTGDGVCTNRREEWLCPGNQA